MKDRKKNFSSSGEAETFVATILALIFLVLSLPLLQSVELRGGESKPKRQLVGEFRR